MTFYVIGFNLYYGSLKDKAQGFKWLDLEVLCRKHLIHRTPSTASRYFSPDLRPARRS